MIDVERLVQPPALWHGTDAAWLDAYCNTVGRMRPELKPAVVTAMAHAAQATQGWVAPTVVAMLDAMT